MFCLIKLTSLSGDGMFSSSLCVISLGSVSNHCLVGLLPVSVMNVSLYVPMDRSVCPVKLIPGWLWQWLLFIIKLLYYLNTLQQFRLVAVIRWVTAEVEVYGTLLSSTWPGRKVAQVRLCNRDTVHGNACIQEGWSLLTVWSSFDICHLFLSSIYWCFSSPVLWVSVLALLFPIAG